MSDHDPSQHQNILESRKQTDCSDHEKRLIGVEHASQSIKAMLETQDGKLDRILEKISRIDILEEKHSTHQADITRAHRKIELLEAAHNVELDVVAKRVDELSVESRKFMNETNGMARMAWIIWTMMGSGLALMLVKVLFFSSKLV